MSNTVVDPCRRQEKVASSRSPEPTLLPSCTSEGGISHIHRRNRRGLFAFSLLSTLFFVGAALGWGPMQLMLEKNGAYANKCTQENLDPTIICSQQTAKLVKIGLTITMTQVTAPVLGILVDHIGPKRSAYFQAACVIVALAMLIFATFFHIDWLLYIGFSIFALHTWIGSLLIVQLGLYFGGHTTSRVIFSLNTFFDAGTIVFLGLWAIEEKLNTSTPRILTGYLCLGALIYGGSSYFWMVAIPETDETKALAVPDNAGPNEEDPRTQHLGNDNTSTQQIHIYRTSLLPEASKAMSHCSDSTKSVNTTDNNEQTLLSNIPFQLLCIFFGLQVATSNWNSATQRDFLAGLGDDEENNKYLTIFTLLTPVSILGSPLIDWVLWRAKWTTALQLVNGLSLAFQLVKVTSDRLDVQILGFLLFSFYRAFLFGISFSFLPCLVPERLVGWATGVMTGCAGIGNLLMIPLVRVAVQRGQGNFWVANLAALGLTVPSIAVVHAMKVLADRAASSGPLEDATEGIPESTAHATIPVTVEADPGSPISLVDMSLH